MLINTQKIDSLLRTLLSQITFARLVCRQSIASVARIAFARISRSTSDTVTGTVCNKHNADIMQHITIPT